MSRKALAEAERASLDLILEDLRFLFDKEEIDSSDLNTVLNNLKSDEAKTYINNLFAGSKPETALRESFFTSDRTFAKFLYGYAESSPEVVENGFVDYLIKDELGHTVVLELKSLFYSQKEKDKAGAIKVKKLKQQVLDWSKHKEQIKSYITKGDYIILTNLKEWFFFSRSLNPINPEPFDEQSLHEFIVEYENYGKNFKEFCDRKEYQAVRYELDKEFLGSLDRWVKKLSAVKFKADEKRKLELIIGLINKFIFIQTLDDYGVIRFKWIQNNWQYYESQWVPKGKAVMFEEFLSAVDKWFFKYYDTELFRGDVLKHVEKEKKNSELFYEILRDVLGVTYLQKPIGFKGIIQYNFRLIDEDVLGKAYETFLAKVRKEEGIYYTPKYITQYIAENTVGRVFDELLAKIKENLEKEQFEDVKELVLNFTSIRALDPACGSGSFLIKAIKIVTNKYSELNQLIESAERILRQRYSNYLSSLDVPREIRAKLELFSEIRDIIGPRNKRELISRILVRHIHGVDLDKRALEVAKVNIWLEAIKLAPKEFRYDRLPPDTNYILPNLEMNLCTGDSLAGLPVESIIKYLRENHQADITKLCQLRRNYLENPIEPKFVEEVEDLKRKIRNRLKEKFTQFLETKDIPIQISDETKPFHWALEFWYRFFDEKGASLSDDLRGFDIVLGNPPYVENKRLNPLIKKYLHNCGTYRTAYKLFDYAVPFIERALQLLNRGGRFGYIVTNKFTVTDYGVKIREILAKDTTIEQILDVSYLPVFKGTAIYPIILTFTKLEPSEGHEVIIAPKVSSEDDIIQIKYRHIKTKQTAILKTPGYIFDISGNILLCDKIRSLDIIGPKEIASIGYRVLKFTGWGELLENVTDQRPNAPHLKFIGCRNIEPYLINWDSELRLAGRSFRNSYMIKPSQADESKWKLLELPKILIREVGIKLTAALDENGEYGNLTGMYALYNLNSNYEPRFLLALLNSSLLNFYYKSLYGSTHMAGGYLNFHGSYIKNLPLLKVEATQQKTIANYVRRLEALKKADHILFKIWREWCTRLKNDEYSLYKVVSEDAGFIKIGEFDKAWTSKVTFYPTENEMSNIVFNDFRIIGQVSKHVIGIYGLDENNKEQLVYEMEFSNRDLMLHVYCSLLQALGSRRKIKNLFQLFAKTIVPIIKEVNRSPNELTPNMIKKINPEFERWLKEERIENVEADIVKIDNEIENIEAEIDALVFKLYKLREDEIKVVFNSLKTPTSHQGRVLEFFRKL